MNSSDKNINKTLYKIFLIIVKYVPTYLAIIQTANIISNSLKINIPILSFLGGTSIPFLIILFIMSWVFKFCYLYRIPLLYLTINWCIAFIDLFIGIPISTLNLLRVYIFNFGIFIIFYVWYMYKNRHKPNVDHIRQLCENYASCCA